VLGHVVEGGVVAVVAVGDGDGGVAQDLGEGGELGGVGDRPEAVDVAEVVGGLEGGRLGGVAVEDGAGAVRWVGNIEKMGLMLALVARMRSRRIARGPAIVDSWGRTMPSSGCARRSWAKKQRRWTRSPSIVASCS
jgi:hypothetical protein